MRPLIIGRARLLLFDGYGGYRALAERGDVELAFCWSHVRRRFYELAGTDPRVSGTALQTTGSKGHDGIAILRVSSPA